MNNGYQPKRAPENPRPPRGGSGTSATRDLHAELAVLNAQVDANNDDLELRRRRDTCRAALTTSAARDLYLKTYPNPIKTRKKRTMSKNYKAKPADDKIPTNAEFVRAYQTSSTTAEAAEKLGIPEHAGWVGMKAGALKKVGVALKDMPRAKSYDRVDVDGLNALIQGIGQ